MSQVTFYRVTNWEERFENSRTRTMKTMMWVPVPNRHDGEGYLTLVRRPNGIAFYGAWQMILQVASKCPIRGVLLREDGTAHDAKSISLKTSTEPEFIDAAFPVIAQIGWLEQITDEVAVVHKKGIRSLSVGCQAHVIEGREGKVEKELEGKELNEEKEGSAPSEPTLRAALSVAGLKDASERTDLILAVTRKGWGRFTCRKMLCAAQKVTSWKSQENRVAKIITATERDKFSDEQLAGAERMLVQYGDERNGNGTH